MKRTIRSVSIGSALKVGAFLYGMLFAVFGGISLALMSLLNLAATNGVGSELGGLGAGAAFGILALYFIGIVGYAIIGGIFSAIAAMFYNLVSLFVGGLSIELE